MSFDAFFKRTIYWCIDLIKGNGVLKSKKEIEYVMSNYELGKDIQTNKLNQLLDYATEYSEFYKQYRGLNFNELPVVNKLVLTENYLKNVIDIKNIPNQKGEVFIQKTSGSTGVPFKVPQDTQKRLRRVAELKYFNEEVGFKSHEKLGHCRIWTSWHSKSKKQIFWENIIPIDISSLDDSRMKNILDTIKNNKLIALRAYASWYDYLIDYLQRNPQETTNVKTLKVCFSISEALNPVTKDKMLNLLGVNVVEAYADEEIGTLAHQKIGSNNFYLNHADCIFEFLKLDEDTPATPGELSRIVVTDLHNYAFPMIRYDTGDTAIFSSGDISSCGWPYISNLYGRKMDIVYDIHGNPIHPMNFGRVLKNYNSIKQWQFIQNGKNDYCIKLELHGDVDTKAITDSILSILGGATANLTIEQVEEIPVLKSGKRKPVVCNM